MPRRPKRLPTMTLRAEAGVLTLLLLLSLLGGQAEPADAAMVAPHALFIDHRVRSTSVHVLNPDDVPVEIKVELIYGYPRGDGDGGVRVFLEDLPAPGDPSCAGWVKAYPRRVTLLPGQKQTIRLLAKPPAALPDGEYWSRVVIISQAAPEVQDLEGSEGVRVGLTLSTRTIISLNYRKGPMSTGIEVPRLRGSVDSAAVHLEMDLRRKGTAAWLGQLDVVLMDPSGKELQRWDRALAVYEDHGRRLEFPLDSRLIPGHYTLSMRYSTERKDLPPEGILPSEEVIRSMALSFPDTLGD